MTASVDRLTMRLRQRLVVRSVRTRLGRCSRGTRSTATGNRSPTLSASAAVKHHFVPAFYLRGFVERRPPTGHEPALWVADRQEAVVRRRSPKNAAALTDYYAVTTAEGKKDQSAETSIAALESAVSSLLHDLPESSDALAVEDRAFLSRFVAVQMTRVPAYRSYLERTISKTRTIVVDMLTHDRRLFAHCLRKAYPERAFSESQVERVFTAAGEGEWVIPADPESSLYHALKVAEGVAPLMDNMDWTFLVDSDETLVTSDNPVQVFHSASRKLSNSALLNRDAEITLPLTPRVCLVMAHGKLPGRMASANAVKAMNEFRIFGARRFVYAHTRSGADAAIRHWQER